MARSHVIAQYTVTGVITISLGIAYLVIYGLFGFTAAGCQTQLPTWVIVSGPPSSLLLLRYYYRDNCVLFAL